MAVLASQREPVVYPESDGKPMADSTKQFRWIVTIEGGLEALFHDREAERRRAQQRAERLAQRLRELGIDPEQIEPREEG